MLARAAIMVALLFHHDMASAMLEYNIKTFGMANMDYKDFLLQPMDVHRMGDQNVFVLDTVRNRIVEYTVDDTNRFLFISHREVPFEGVDTPHAQYRHRIVRCTQDTSESFLVLGGRDGVFFRYSSETNSMVQENMLTERLNSLLVNNYFLTDVAISEYAVTKACMSSITGNRQYPFFVLDAENKKIYTFSNKISGHKQTFNLPLKIQSPVAIELVSESDVTFELLLSDYMTGSIYRCFYQYDVDYYLVPTDHCWERVAGQGIRGDFADGSVQSSVLLGPGSMQSVWDGKNVIFLDQDPRRRESKFRVLWLKPNASDCFVETLNFVSSDERGSVDGGFDMGSFEALWDFSYNGVVKEIIFAEILTRKIRIVQNVDIARCDRAGLFLDGITCKSCSSGNYCVGDAIMRPCPMGTYSKESAKNVLECYCPRGYISTRDLTNSNVTCSKCDKNVICNEEEGFFGPCPANSVGLEAFYPSDCLCNSGFKKDTSGQGCIPCDPSNEVCGPPTIYLSYNFSVRLDINTLTSFNSDIFVQIYNRFIRDNTAIVVVVDDIVISFYRNDGEIIVTNRKLLQLRRMPAIEDVTLNIMVQGVHYTYSNSEVLDQGVSVLKEFFQMQQVSPCTFLDGPSQDSCMFDNTQKAGVFVSGLQQEGATVCPANSVLRSSVCVCDKGFETASCSPCPQGYYQSTQEVAYMSRCTMCPPGTTTSGTGSVSAEQCYLKTRRDAMLGFSSLQPEVKSELSSSLVLLVAVSILIVAVVGYLLVHYISTHYQVMPTEVRVQDSSSESKESAHLVYPGHRSFMSYRVGMKRDEDLNQSGDMCELNIDENVLRLLNVHNRRFGSMPTGF